MSVSTCNPYTVEDRIAAHKAMAIAALHADSSLSTRLNRYNEHMERARSLELLADFVTLLQEGGAQ